MPLTKVTRFVSLATNHFSGTIKQNNAKNVRRLSFMIHKYQNASVRSIVLMNTTEDVSNAKSQTFGTQKQSNVNGALKHLFTKKSVADVFVQQVILTCRMEFASTVKHQSTGIIKIKHAKDVRILLFMIRKNKNAFVLLTHHMCFKVVVFHAICLIIGIQT